MAATDYSERIPFGDWIREDAGGPPDPNCPAVHARKACDCFERATAGLAAQLYDAASPFEAFQEKATDPRVGLTQPVTVAEAEALNAALDACKEFLEKYQ